MGTLTVLPPSGPKGPKEPSADVVDLLKDLLDRALAGDIHAVAVGFLQDGGIFTTFTAGEGDFPGLLGAVTVLQARMANGD